MKNNPLFYLIVSFALVFALTSCKKSNSKELQPNSKEYQIVTAQIEVLRQKGIENFWQTKVDSNAKTNYTLKDTLAWLSQNCDMKILSLEVYGEESLRVIIQGTNENEIYSFLLNQVDGEIFWVCSI